MKNYIQLCVFISLGLFISCKHDTPAISGPELSFKTDIQPLINSSCANPGCHDGNEEFSLRTYDQIMDHGDVKSGNPEGSKLYKVTTWTTYEERMPPNNQLSDDQILRIYQWIKQGVKNN